MGARQKAQRDRRKETRHSSHTSRSGYPAATIMKDLYQPRLLNWFILLWMGLIYIWGVERQDRSGDMFTILTLILFTVLMVLHTSIHWISLSGLLSRLRQNGLLLICVIQGILALGICMVVHEWDVTISLFLTLVLEASTLPAGMRLIAASSSVLFFPGYCQSLYPQAS